MTERARLTEALDGFGLSRPDTGKRPTGAIVWEGASAIDGKPIAVVINWGGVLDPKAANDKTGAMVQSYIIPTAPEAIAKGVKGLTSGFDYSVCGDCKHRPALYKQAGASPCYVNIGQGVLGVIRSFHKRAYPTIDHKVAAKLVSGLSVRFGTWGDPGAAPIYIWQSLASRAKSRTGYTHRWMDTASSVDWQSLVMASVDSPKEAIFAEASGWATFETVSDPGQALREGQARCPSDNRNARKTPCIRCPLQCSGTEPGPIKSRQILVHGPGDIGRRINRARKLAAGGIA